jgi:hypothetical protein
MNSKLAMEHRHMTPIVNEIPTLILGMDVSHGSPGRSDIPSIAAVCLLPSVVITSNKYLVVYPLSTLRIGCIV